MGVANRIEPRNAFGRTIREIFAPRKYSAIRYDSVQKQALHLEQFSP